MSISVTWDNEEKTIVRFIYKGKWTWDEFYNSIQQGNAMMQTVPYPVVSIVDMTATRYIPPNAFSHMKRVIEMSQKQNNSNISVFLKSEEMVKVMLKVLHQIYPEVEDMATFHHEQSLDEARRLAKNLQMQLNKPDSNAS